MNDPDGPRDIVDPTAANCDALNEIIKKIAVCEDELRVMKGVRDILMEIPEVKRRRQEHLAATLEANPGALAEAIAKSATSKKPAEPVRIIYTNYKGKTSDRRIVPDTLWFGETEYHPEPQWLLKAFDLDKDACRDFAMRDIKEWKGPE